MKVDYLFCFSDGTWMTRGHTSNVGAASTIGLKTGKVLGVGTRSKQCKSCEQMGKQDKDSRRYKQWAAKHKQYCTMNHDGSSGSMEGQIVKDIFSESIQKHSLRYTRFIGDGDSNTFKTVSEAKPYGESVVIEKIECVGHVQKRMGTRLRNLKKSMKGVKLEDGKTMFGRGRLTDVQIDKLQQMYGVAIRANKHNLAKMKQNVWAIYFHKMSTDARPMHELCTASCPYKVARQAKKVYSHKRSLPVAIMNKIKPIFKDLSNPVLLRKCLEGYTQNANESFNNVVWRFCPKHKNHGLRVMNQAVSIATAVFNDGAKAYGSVMKEMGLDVGPFAESCFADIDTERIKNAQRQALAATKEARITMRQQKKNQNELAALREGVPYHPGAH